WSCEAFPGFPHQLTGGGDVRGAHRARHRGLRHPRTAFGGLDHRSRAVPGRDRGAADVPRRMASRPASDRCAAPAAQRRTRPDGHAGADPGRGRGRTRGRRHVYAPRQQLSAERCRMDTPGLPPVEDSVELLADERRARRVLELLPDSGGLVQSLRLDATFGTLAVDELDPLHTFCEEFKKTSFDNPRSHTAFMNLYRAAEALSIWVN